MPTTRLDGYLFSLLKPAKDRPGTIVHEIVTWTEPIIYHISCWVIYQHEGVKIPILTNHHWVTSWWSIGSFGYTSWLDKRLGKFRKNALLDHPFYWWTTRKTMSSHSNWEELSRQISVFLQVQALSCCHYPICQRPLRCILGNSGPEKIQRRCHFSLYIISSGLDLLLWVFKVLRLIPFIALFSDVSPCSPSLSQLILSHIGF